ncbi:hypothetical protein [Microvirga sp. 2TAF3]|uniref:hypothetical protein n=1 Tax=Microvirga sp. 2TAF3 TaxID=3233014 RepID=UPI003F964B05
MSGTPIFDEELNLDVSHVLNIPKSHPIITQYLSLEAVTDRYSRLKINDIAEVQAIANNKSGDEVWGKLQTFARYLCSEDWETYVLTNSFTKLLSRKNVKLTAYSVRKASSLSIFKSVRFASALFEHTLLYQGWKAQGVNFIEDQDLKRGLSFSEHENGHLLTIKWGLPGVWSKHHRNQAGVEDAIIKAMRRDLADQSFLWQQNKDRADTLPFLGMDGAKELPNFPHGLNDFSGYHTVAILTAAHLAPDRRKFHQELWGLAPSQIGTHLLSVYQAVMRSSLRKPQCTGPKTILIPDYATVKSLLDIFPGSRAVQLDVGLESSEVSRKRGRPRIHKDDAERLRAWRRKNQAKHQISDAIHMLVPRI